MTEETTAKSTGEILEKNIALLFNTAGFQTETNVRIAKYEVDVLATIGSRKIVIECKNYQNSNLVIRNLIHQWHSKNEIINADKIILVIYGVNVKSSDRDLASKFNMEIFSQEDVNELFPLMMQPDKLEERLLKKVALKPVKISEVYSWPIAQGVFYPVLQGKERDEEYTLNQLADYLRTFIRTELRINGTTSDERNSHFELFEKRDKNKDSFSSGFSDSDQRWERTKKRLRSKTILDEKTQKKYLAYADDLEKELENAIQYYIKDKQEERVYRLVQARLRDLGFDDSISRLGFSENDHVEIRLVIDKNSPEGFYYIISVPSPSEEDIEQLKWILTDEPFSRSIPIETNQGTTYIRIKAWKCSSLDQITEMTIRILDEFYGVEEGRELRDFALEQQKKSGCFIATAAYGTPFAEEINILRKWRDTRLQSSFGGRLFIQTYYTISPPIARVIEKSNLLKSIVRKFLHPIVQHFKRSLK